MNTLTIARREMGSYFTSLIAYVVIGVFLLMSGYFYYTNMVMFVMFLGTDVTLGLWQQTFYDIRFVTVSLLPLLTMRLFAEEKKMGTIELLLTMPITAWQAIVGKFLASWLFLALALVLTFPVVITVNYLGHPDNGVILTAYVGSWLMAGAYLAISCITSALTRSQVVSFIISLVVCLFLILAGFPPVINVLEQLAAPRLVDLVTSFSVMTHFEGFQKGVLDSRDILFFLSVIGFSLFTTSVILRTHRAG